MPFGFIVMTVLTTSLAWASDDPTGHGSNRSMIYMLTMLGLISGAYLITHFVLNRLQKRFLFISGVEYVLLGLVLSQSSVLPDLASLGAVIAFAAGWIGIIRGMELEAGKILKTTGYALRLSLITTLCTAGGVTAAAYLGLSELFSFSSDEAWLGAAALGCAASAGSSSAIKLLVDRYGAIEGGLLPLLGRSARFDDALAILSFGVLMCVFHTGETLTQQPPTTSVWVLFTVLLGGSLGWLFAAFLAHDSSENSRFLALVGITAFASGAAFFLNLSILTVNLVLGMVLISTRHGRHVYDTLTGTTKPLSLILLVFGGLLWQPVDLIDGVILSIGFLACRILCRLIGGWVASLGTPLRKDLYRGMFAQGHVALAIGLTFQLVYDGPVVDLVFTAILVTVMFNEFIAPRLLKGLLVDAGDVRQDVVIGRWVK